MRFRPITSYRYPTEQWILFITCAAVLLVILLTAVLTLRVSLIVIFVGLLVAYLSNRVRQADLIRTALLVNDQSRACFDRPGQGMRRKDGLWADPSFYCA